MELEQTGRIWLYDALRVSRPGYFMLRGPSSPFTAPRLDMLVVVNGLPVDDVEMLQSLRVAEVREVRRLDPVETYIKYGRRVMRGTLEVDLSGLRPLVGARLPD
jgi:hypothetical protein